MAIHLYTLLYIIITKKKTRTAYTRVGNIDIEGYAHDMGFTSYPSGCQQTFL